MKDEVGRMNGHARGRMDKETGSRGDEQHER